MKKLNTPLYAYATVAYHLMGEISRFEDGEWDYNSKGLVENGVRPLEDHICEIWYDSDKNWIGNWITGGGFVKVEFPKDTTRALTLEEIEKFENMRFRISSGPAYNYSNIQTI